MVLKYFFSQGWVGGLVAEPMWWVGCGAYVLGWKMIPRIRLTSAKDLVEVEAELGNYPIPSYFYSAAEEYS